MRTGNRQYRHEGKESQDMGNTGSPFQQGRGDGEGGALEASRDTETGQEACSGTHGRAGSSGGKVEQGARAAMADPGIRGAMAEQGARAAMADPGISGCHGGSRDSGSHGGSGDSVALALGPATQTMAI